MVNYWEEHTRIFKNRYHERSNAESTNSAFKRKFGVSSLAENEIAESKTAIKVLIYNINLLIRYKIKRWRYWTSPYPIFPITYNDVLYLEEFIRLRVLLQTWFPFYRNTNTKNYLSLGSIAIHSHIHIHYQL